MDPAAPAGCFVGKPMPVGKNNTQARAARFHVERAFHEYVGTFGSMVRDQRSMPPATD
jgi:hypothetical protein